MEQNPWAQSRGWEPQLLMKSGFPQHRLTEAAMELVQDDFFSFFTRTCFLSSAEFPRGDKCFPHGGEGSSHCLLILWEQFMSNPPPTDSRCAQSSHPPLNRWSLPLPTLQDHHHTTRGPTTTWGSRELNLTEEGSEAAPVATTSSCFLLKPLGATAPSQAKQ